MARLTIETVLEKANDCGLNSPTIQHAALAQHGDCSLKCESRATVIDVVGKRKWKGKVEQVDHSVIRQYMKVLITTTKSWIENA